MDTRKKLLIFVSFFIIAFIFWRLRVFLFFNNGELPFLREITGLAIHHYHYGLIFVLIASLLLIFHKINGWSVGLMGFGLGSVFDSFISRLFKSGGTRIGEIANYNNSLFVTLILFVNIILLSVVFYYFGRDKV